MDETDAFFTHTIVGAPLSVLLGRRQAHPNTQASGLKVDLGTGETRLSRLWQEWVVLSHACDPVGQPRLRPGRLRRALERHALWIALAGALALVGTAVFWGVWLWS
ncbi:hypothetical protein [Hydrogenophaga sp.]|uniref:hypothetical protein n=1 Tax=Hydrogenophaga sp. TaxID=1904254 RepID=UPI00286E9A08|nr:hypothetical protein [Hydrogenophaga sp.]